MLGSTAKCCETRRDWDFRRQQEELEILETPSNPADADGCRGFSPVLTNPAWWGAAPAAVMPPRATPGPSRRAACPAHSSEAEHHPERGA